MGVEVRHGDCLAVMREMADNSIDAVVTDPPYGLTNRVIDWSGFADNSERGTPILDRTQMKGFMGKEWDGTGIQFSVALWSEVLRVLKPGGHLLSFSGSRTYHRMACAIEDAGFEIRDQIMWVYGSGWPKSLDISKALDRMAGAEREIVGHSYSGRRKESTWNPSGRASGVFRVNDDGFRLTAPATDAAKQWEGWHTALKPSHEPIVLARKKLSEKTVAENVLRWGTGGLNVDRCRVETQESLGRNNHARKGGTSYVVQREDRFIDNSTGKGRYPANFLHDGSQEVLELFPETNGSKPIQRREGFRRFNGNDYAGGKEYRTDAYLSPGYTDTGSAARFFYAAKASRAERRGSKHPTIKPLKLMQYLVRLITPPGGTLLDPFAGSGTTGEAALLEGFNAILIEQEAEYIADIKHRLGMEAIA